MKKILLKILLAIVILIGLGSIFVGYTDNRVIFTLKNSIPLELRMFIKKTFLFPFSHQNEINQLKKSKNKLVTRTNELENQIEYLREYLNDIDLNKSEGKVFSLPLLGKNKIITSKNNNNFNLKKYYFVLSTPWQYNGRKPSGYLEKFNDQIFILNGEGLIGFFDKKDLNEDKLNFKILKTNFEDIIPNDSNMYEPGRASFRGIIIEKENIYISYYKRIKDNCYNVGILKANFNFDFLKFSEFFAYDECSTQMSNHSGAKMVPYNEESFFFTIGDGQLFINAQKDESFFGKIFKINYKDSKFELISKGMRDTQGAFWYEKLNMLIMTEHGPQGGDEINILREDELDKNINFGWPIATYGELGPTPIKENKFTAKDKNNHTPNGFKEPAYWFKGKSVAPSAIINVDGFKEGFDRDFFMSAMGNVPAPGRRSIHHFKLDEKLEKLISSDIIPIGERIRDLIFLNEEKKVILLLENTPSVAVIQSN
tara:strand:- start:146 stop:1594 length:1449 start_codon:yes stop_codon:yes gene_type:complete